MHPLDPRRLEIDFSTDCGGLFWRMKVLRERE